MLRIPYILRRLQSLPFFWHSVYVARELLMTFREAEVRCWESAAAADVPVAMSSYATVRELKDYAETQIQANATKLRLFYNGREMKDDLKLGHHALKDDCVVQVFFSAL